MNNIFSGKYCLEGLERYDFEMSHVMRKPVITYANNTGADQPTHPRCLISIFVVHCLDSTIPLLAIAEISRP